MLILGVDTSGRNGSLAMVRYGGALPEKGSPVDVTAFETLEFVPLAGGSYSADVVPALEKALERRGIALSEIDLFAVASGPGSFTGLRVGLSTVKGFAEALQKPVAAVTVLEAVVLGSGREGRVIAALDAQRNEVFMGEYVLGASNGRIDLEMVSETLAATNDFTTWLSALIPVPATLTPDSALAKRVSESGSPAEEVARPGADAYARIGFMRFVAGQCISVEKLDANYIRRSDAEIFSAPKLKSPQV
jgi:tRNA threonylcarbamoyladenosine biosynthesis protein TsaB